jgi:hypothetical protein
MIARDNVRRSSLRILRILVALPWAMACSSSSRDAFSRNDGSAGGSPQEADAALQETGASQEAGTPQGVGAGADGSGQDDASTLTDSASGGAVAPGEPTGIVHFLQLEGNGVNVTAAFDPPDLPLLLPDPVAGRPCLAFDMPSQRSTSWKGPRPQAGTIIFSGGKIPSGGISLVPNPQTGGYDLLRPTLSLPLDDGISLQVHATGGTIPTFDAQVAMPPTHAGISSPQLPYTQYNQTIDRTQDITLSWPSFVSGRVEVELISSFPILCSFDASQLKGTIPTAILQKMPASGTGSISTMFTARTIVAAGPFSILVEASQRYDFFLFTISK